MTCVTLLYYCLWFSILQLPFALTKLGECKSEQYTIIKATEYSFILSAVKNIQNCWLHLNSGGGGSYVMCKLMVEGIQNTQQLSWNINDKLVRLKKKLIKMDDFWEMRTMRNKWKNNVIHYNIYHIILTLD